MPHQMQYDSAMPKNTWLAVIIILAINSVGGLGYFYFRLPDETDMSELIKGLSCGLVAVLLTVNYRRKFGKQNQTNDR